MANKLTKLFEIGMTGSKLTGDGEDYITQFIVKEKSTGKVDLFHYSTYWNKVEPRHGYFNHYEIDPSVSQWMEFSDHINDYIHLKHKDIIDKGNEILNSVTNDNLETFINSI